MADDNASESKELFQRMVDLNSKIDRMRATTAIQMRRKRRIIKVDFFTLSLGRELSFRREGGYYRKLLKELFNNNSAEY